MWEQEYFQEYFTYFFNSLKFFIFKDNPTLFIKL